MNPTRRPGNRHGRYDRYRFDCLDGMAPEALWEVLFVVIEFIFTAPL